MKNRTRSVLTFHRGACTIISAAVSLALSTSPTLGAAAEPGADSITGDSDITIGQLLEPVSDVEVSEDETTIEAPNPEDLAGAPVDIVNTEPETKSKYYS